MVELEGACSREAVIKDLRIDVLQRVRAYPEGSTTPGMRRRQAALGEYRAWVLSVSTAWAVSGSVREV